MVATAVESVLAQTYRPIEIVLVNDGSSDDTAQVLERMEAQHPDEIIVLHQANAGPGLAREAGRLVATGEYIQYLDSDDWLLPCKFEVQVQALESNPQCDIAYGISQLVDEEGGVLQSSSKWTGEKFDYLFPALLVDRWWHTHTPLFRRRISDAAGAWPNRRPEDWDLEARMGAHKARLVFCDVVVSCQREHAGEERVRYGQVESYLRDEAWFLPRLYACALQAGVPVDAPEMTHFSNWAFMRARQLGALGEAGMATELLDLARSSSVLQRTAFDLVGLAAVIIGWRLTGKLCNAFDRMRGMAAPQIR